MRVASAFHAIRSVIGARSPSRYSRTMRDQMRSFERSSWNAPAICRESRKPCSHIMSSRNASWLSLMKSVSSPASVKSICAAKKPQRRQPVVAIACHRGGGDGQQRAAEAIAGRVHLPIRDDRRDRVERRHDSERAIVVERDVAILGTGVLPRDHEHGESLVDQVLDEGIRGRKVEDVVLHDPRRHDEDRLRPHLRRRWRILDELDQAGCETPLCRA